MKRFLFALLMILTVFPANAADEQQVQNFAQSLADQIMERVVLAKTSPAQKRAAFREVFLKATDINKIARFTLGRYAR